MSRSDVRKTRRILSAVRVSIDSTLTMNALHRNAANRCKNMNDTIATSIPPYCAAQKKIKCVCASEGRLFVRTGPWGVPLLDQRREDVRVLSGRKTRRVRVGRRPSLCLGTRRRRRLRQRVQDGLVMGTCRHVDSEGVSWKSTLFLRGT
jgi:hypothetical protein